jgi:hypothetical protein
VIGGLLPDAAGVGGAVLAVGVERDDHGAGAVVIFNIGKPFFEREALAPVGDVGHDGRVFAGVGEDAVIGGAAAVVDDDAGEAGGGELPQQRQQRVARLIRGDQGELWGCHSEFLPSVWWKLMPKGYGKNLKTS